MGIRSRGFTLLLAALVASIVLALGAAIYSIAFKQVSLSSIGRDSQFAFYAADTIAECVLYWDVARSHFTTSTPPLPITCDSETRQVTAASPDGSTPATGGYSFASGGAYTLAMVGVPAAYGTLTVTVHGGGGGGGGGANVGRFPGGYGGSGGTSSFGTDLVALGGGGGPGEKLSGTTDGSCTSGTASLDGAVYPSGTGQGAAGGSGGSGDPSGRGGDGCAGGMVVKQYRQGEIDINTLFNVSVGGAGLGGTAPSPASPGLLGQQGSVTLSWSGGTRVWTKTIFTFQTETNKNCADITFTKTAASGGTVRNNILANGYNVPCSSLGSSPRALQRSIQFSY